MERRGFMGMLGAAWAAMSARLFAGGVVRADEIDAELRVPDAPVERSTGSHSAVEAMAIVQFSQWCKDRGFSFDVGLIGRKTWALNVYASPHNEAVACEMCSDLLTVIEGVKLDLEHGDFHVRDNRKQLQLAARVFNRLCDIRELHWRVEKIGFEYRIRVWGSGVLKSWRGASLLAQIGCATHDTCHWLDWFKGDGWQLRSPVATDANPLSQLVGTSDEIRALLMGKA